MSKFSCFNRFICTRYVFLLQLIILIKYFLSDFYKSYLESVIVISDSNSTVISYLSDELDGIF